METNQPQTSTSIAVEQKIGTVSGGLAAGLYIQSLTGQVVFRPSAPPEPPERATIESYLKAASQEIRPKLPDKATKKIVEGLEALWNIPFRAHRAGSEELQALDEIVNQVLDENQKRNGYQRLVLLADVGMGKTAALQSSIVAKVAAQTLGSQPAADPASSVKPVIPIYVNLTNVRAGQDFGATLSAAFNARASQKISDSQALGLLNAQDYTCLLLLDDLDQLLSMEQRGGFQVLCQLMEAYPEHRYVVSCRTSANRQQLGTLDELYLAALSAQDVQSILTGREFKALSNTSQKLSRNRAALEQYFRKGRSADLLETKGHYLDILVQDRLKTAAGKFADQNMDAALAGSLLESVAIRMRLDRTRTYSERQIMLAITDYLAEWREAIPWRKAVSALVDGEFLEYDRARKLWSFCDRCDEAYFAAMAVVNGRVQLAILMQEASHLWWRDVLEILVGLHKDPRSLLLELIDRDAFVGANCLQYAARPVAQACEEALADVLSEEFWGESSTRKTRVVEYLGAHTHPRACEALLRILFREWSSMVLMATLRALIAWIERHEDGAEPVEALRAAEGKIQHTVEHSFDFTEELLTACTLNRPEDRVSQQVSFLKDTSQSSRSRSLVALILGIKRHNDAGATLLKIVDSENSDDLVAWCAAEAIALLPPRKDVNKWARVTIRKKNVVEKSAQQKQARAVYLLGRVGMGSETEQLLLSALHDPHNHFARGYAAMAIAGLDFKNARQQIETLMTQEKEPWVLRQCAEALGLVGTLESLPLLEKHLRSPESSARWMVRRAIHEIIERNAL
jgi:HEAT repeat protein